MRSQQERERLGTIARQARRHVSISVDMLEGRQLLATAWSGMGFMASPAPAMQSSMSVMMNSPVAMGGATQSIGGGTTGVTFAENMGGSSSGGATFSMPTGFLAFNEVIMPTTLTGSGGTNPTPPVTSTNPKIVTPHRNTVPPPPPAPSPVSAAVAPAGHHATPTHHIAVSVGHPGHPIAVSVGHPGHPKR
jgi:hypothetical protein